MRYYNADGSRASLCGNASLCSTRLAIEIGLVPDGEFTLETDAGNLRARMTSGLPEIDLEPVDVVRPDATELGRSGAEKRLGFALVGVPHVVIQVPDLEQIDLPARGSVTGPIVPMNVAWKGRPWPVEQAPWPPPSCLRLGANPAPKLGSRPVPGSRSRSSCVRPAISGFHRFAAKDELFSRVRWESWPDSLPRLRADDGGSGAFPIRLRLARLTRETQLGGGSGAGICLVHIYPQGLVYITYLIRICP